MSLALLFHYTTSEYIQETLSKHTARIENSITIRHRNSQYLQKHASKKTAHVTTKPSPLNKYANAETSILAEQYNP